MIDITDRIKECRIMPEQQLFMAIIVQAFVDITTQSIDARERAQAKEFVSRPNNRLKAICELAGVPMSCVIKAAKKDIDKNWLLNIRRAKRNM